MKPTQPRMIHSTRNYITIGWDNCNSVSLRKIEESEVVENGEEEKKRWFILEKKDRILGWCRAYVGFKTQTQIGPLAPRDYYEFRLKVTTGREESEWSDTLFAITKEDVVPAAQLHRVVENGPVTSLRRILSLRPAAIHIPNKFQQTPLRLAILKNNTNFMGILLNNGAEIEDPEPGSGRTPLMTASLYGHLEAVQLLLEKGSSWEAKDRNGLTALNYAVDNSRIEILPLAVEAGVDLNAKDKFGWTPLMRGVILKSSLEVLIYLLENGSDPNEADDRNQTALMQAVLSGRPEVVELLLEKGADINVTNVYGHTAYDMAKSSTSDEEKENSSLSRELEDEGTEVNEDLKEVKLIGKCYRTRKIKQKLSQAFQEWGEPALQSHRGSTALPAHPVKSILGSLVGMGSYLALESHIPSRPVPAGGRHSSQVKKKKAFQKNQK